MAAEGIHDLPLVGGHIALDLVNTVEPRYATTDQREHLSTPEALLTWAVRAGIVDEAAAGQVAADWQSTPTAGSSDLMAALELRAHVYAALGALMESRPPQLAPITSAWAAATSRSALVADDDGVRVAPAVSIPDRLAIATVDLLTTLDLARLRACPGCGWLFLDHSRNNTRRWCVMADCGTTAKSRNLTARRRTDRAAERQN